MINVLCMSRDNQLLDEAVYTNDKNNKHISRLSNTHPMVQYIDKRAITLKRANLHIYTCWLIMQTSFQKIPLKLCSSWVHMILHFDGAFLLLI